MDIFGGSVRLGKMVPANVFRDEHKLCLSRTCLQKNKCNIFHQIYEILLKKTKLKKNAFLGLGSVI